MRLQFATSYSILIINIGSSLIKGDYQSLIFDIRGYKVMIDIDLAMLYGVEIKRLKERVKRNINRFPQDFMFGLSREEKY